MSLEDIEKLKVRVEKDPSSRLFLPLAEEYRKAGMLDEAISVLLKGLDRQPDYTSARVALGKIYLEKRMIEEARREFEKVIAAIPDNLFAHKKLAEIYRDIGEMDRAISEFRTVLKINPLDEDAKSFIERVESRESFVEAPRPETSEKSVEEEVIEIHETQEPLETAGEMERVVSEEPVEESRETKGPLSEGEEFFGIPEDQVFDLSGAEPMEIPPEDMMEVKTPEMKESEALLNEEFAEPITEEGEQEIKDIWEEGEWSQEFKDFSDMSGAEIKETLHLEEPREKEIFETTAEPDFSEADSFVSKGEYFRALESYKVMLKEYPDNKKVLQRIAELKNLLKLLGKDQEIILKLESLLEGIRRRRDEFFGLS